VRPEVPGGLLDLVRPRRLAPGFNLPQSSQTTAEMSEELERVSPREAARAKARDRKVRGPKVVSVNPGLRKLAQHIAEKSRKKR